VNPNTAKYFDENKGCTLNEKCAECSRLIYVPERIETMYHGKFNMHNRHNKVMSVCHKEKGNICHDCWKKEKKQ